MDILKEAYGLNRDMMESTFLSCQQAMKEAGFDEAAMQSWKNNVYMHLANAINDFQYGEKPSLSLTLSLVYAEETARYIEDALMANVSVGRSAQTGYPSLFLNGKEYTPGDIQELALSENICTWYTYECPDDQNAKNIDKNLTFHDLLNMSRHEAEAALGTKDKQMVETIMDELKARNGSLPEALEPKRNLQKEEMDR